MSSANHLYNCEGQGGEAAGYVLGALEPAEMLAFSRHLETCVVCRDEVLEFGRVTDALAISPTQFEAPRRLRHNVHAELRRSVEARRPAGQPERRRAGTARPARTVRRNWALAPVWGAALAAAALALIFIGLPLSGGNHQPVVHTYAASVARIGGSAEVRVAGGHAELLVHHIGAPAAGEIYEVWLRPRGGVLQPTKALFSVTSGGEGVVEVPGNLRHISEVLVTQEPAGGTLHPTSAPVIVAHLA
jgi:anti-sigma-K factor RskA